MNAACAYATSRLLVAEARAARLGLGHWSGCSLRVRKDNARSHLQLAATYRRAVRVGG